MAARGLFRKTVFLPNLVNCLRSQLLLPPKTSICLAVSKEKHCFKALYWNFNRNVCDVNVAIDPRQAKKQQRENKSSGFYRSFYLASLTLGYLWYHSSTAHTANDDDDKDKENTAGRCKGRFMSKGHQSAIKNLAKGKENLKRPMADEHNGEMDFEPTEKKVTRSKQVCLSYRGNCCKCYKVARIFIHLHDAVEYSSKQ